ncbi:hypothetical protein ACH5RR_030352 [Cinchona calisaya]|uniref:Mandelate racemase/muconate lactonizing enzyme C-terminal domain-containing protein n=1 Tax=Cinchona calisaya TaxID=153742 RepID=A0ABD2YUC0_9GENT
MNPPSLLKTQKLPFSIPFKPPLYRKTITISTFNHAVYSSFHSSSHSFTTSLEKPHKNPVLKVVKCLQEDEVMDSRDAALLVSTCITKNLAPALTVDQGLDRIQEAVEVLKANPPSCSRGMFRFQVAVPPSAKALKCFCSQPESGGVYPWFFLSKEENPTYKSLALGRTRGVFGTGAAVYFKGYYSHTSQDHSERQRLNPAMEMDIPMAYGFLDVSFDVISFSIKYEAGSFYFFIPQIELHEFEEVTVLVTTLAWDISSTSIFEEAIRSYELAIYQARHQLQPFPGECRSIRALKEFETMEDKIVEMVCMSALQLSGSVLEAGTLELNDAPRSSQFSALLSPLSAIANKMYQSDCFDKMIYSALDCPNINSLWASLIIEECTRLGLTYICVAPGSRSSPLAIAASAHPTATCVACIDERSLAFHAVGFARGSHRPAVIITSSGTAASNLLPAVVEASQDFLPLLLLTADRPPELQDVGANQAISQVNHFGPFVRHFFGLPAPTDDISARMVLTTLDSAVNIASSSPCGPVHINCPFREPLAKTPRMWNYSCMKGLDLWMSSSEPFTTYIEVQHSISNPRVHAHMDEVIKIIQEADRGLLVLGAIHTVDDIWAALLLAKHLQWPVVVDILSGLRLRKYMTSFTDIGDNILFIDHLDHLLLSEKVRNWMKADVVVQIGSRITSARIPEMLEHSFPFSYIMVDKHPRRHDPLHIVTQRIQSTVTEFTNYLLKASLPYLCSKWKGQLRALDMMAAWEISFLISSEYALTEPYVAHILPENLQYESAVFLGNSMPIRDADMYGLSQTHNTHNAAAMFNLGLPCHWIQVVGNRGASGIDGLLSTAAGFAVGSNKKVLCVIGDVSFLHDTNGLSLLGQGTLRKPMTIVVINNQGGAIFSLLPIAAVTERRILDQFFYTSHNVSIHNLCLANGVKYVQVQTKRELLNALFTSQQEKVDCVVEVESCIDANAKFHSDLKKFSRQAADDAMDIFSNHSISVTTRQGLMIGRITKLDYSLYRVKLCAPPTSTTVGNKSTTFYREGFVLSLSLEDGSTGYGEVAPLEIHEENLLDVEEQLRFLIHVVEGARIDFFVPLLKGSFSSWIWHTLGILPRSILPSVRCGLEMAILNAIAAKESSCMLNILFPKIIELPKELLDVQVCGLIDSVGSPMDMAYIATSMVKEGFAAIKMKVARRANVIEDIAVIQEVRRRVGNQVELRVDANRSWTYEEAIQFAKSVKNCRLQYIEEPVICEDDIIKFCEESGMPVALDETVNCIGESHFDVLKKYSHAGVVAVVIKPSLIGGFENAALVARWAQQQGKMAVVSATFESGLGLSAYIQFSCYLDLQNADMLQLMDKDPSACIAHGLGTYRWFTEDVTIEPLNICSNSKTGFVEASATDAGQLMQQFQINQNVVVRYFDQENVHEYRLKVDLEGFSFSLNVLEMGKSIAGSVIVFLHGFLGTGKDWIPLMKAISKSARCVAIDLPGHGGSKLQIDSKAKPSLSIDVIADMLCQLFPYVTPEKVILVGYSMGARIALYMALKCSDKVEGAVVISGSPGLVDPLARMVRRERDDFRASSLLSYGLEFFLDAWYAEGLWTSLRCHPHFKKILANRLQHDDLHTLAKVLSDLSIGRQPSLWEDLNHCKLPLLIVVGEKDTKFKKIARQMVDKHCTGTQESPKIVEILNSGHAVHLENPLPVISAVRQFLKSIEKKRFQFLTKDDADALYSSRKR